MGCHLNMIVRPTKNFLRPPPLPNNFKNNTRQSSWAIKSISKVNFFDRQGEKSVISQIPGFELDTNEVMMVQKKGLEKQCFIFSHSKNMFDEPYHKLSFLGGIFKGKFDIHIVTKSNILWRFETKSPISRKHIIQRPSMSSNAP